MTCHVVFAVFYMKVLLECKIECCFGHFQISKQNNRRVFKYKIMNLKSIPKTI